VAPSAAVLGLYAGAVTVLNGSMAKRSVEGVWPLNYAPVRMAAIVALVEVMVFLLAWAWLAARERPRGSGQASSRSMAYAGRLATGDDKDKSDRI
jgi:heme/copper-type cytochrome/quinol oxidase subunit 2